MRYPGPLVVGLGGRQTNCAGFARVEVRFAEADGPFACRCTLNDVRFPEALKEATYRGLRRYASELTGIEAEVVAALVHPVDATAAAFERAGARAAELRSKDGDSPSQRPPSRQ